MDKKLSNLKIVFFGTPDFAVASLRALVEHKFHVLAVVTAPDKPSGRGRHIQQSAVKEYALAHNIPVMQPQKLKDKLFLDELKSLNADIQVVVAFRMLPEIVWNMPPMGTLNVHASLLPEYRGAAPINRAIMDGAYETGVTTFRLKHEIDTGNILLQKKVIIQPEDNAGTLYEKLKQEGESLLIETLNGLMNHSITEKEQHTDGQAINKHAPKIFKEDCLINWSNSVEDIHNQIRGLSPLPGAFTYLNDKQLKILNSDIEKSQHEVECGEWQTDGKTYLKFAASDGWLICKEIKLEGKKQMEVSEFLRGFRI